MNRAKRTRRELLKDAGLYASALAIAGCEVAGPSSALFQTEQPPPARPNILWITCEDISPYLGCYGDRQAITPNLDQLARQGALYTNAFATAPVCSPVRSCLITGVYATSLGTQHLRSAVTLPDRIVPFPKLLRATGYYCSNNYKEDYNFTDVTIWDESSHTAHWRNRKAGQPFFSVFNIMSTHQGQINGTDEAFFETYRSKLDPAERHDPAELVLPPFFPDTPTVREIWARYYDLITTMDKEVGELLAQLDADGLTDNTVVFFFSDHGMGLPRFKRTLYDTGLHVPLLVRCPERFQGRIPLPRGVRKDRLVSFVDFPPTVLALAHVPIPAPMQGRVFLGGKAEGPRQYVFGAASRVDEAYEVSRCIRDTRYKYIRHFMPHLPNIQPSEFPDRAEILQELRRVARSGTLTERQQRFWAPTKPVEELYDTQADPFEMRNLAGFAAYEETLARLRQALRDWMLESRDTGLLPEAEMHIRAAGTTVYDAAQDPAQYQPAPILAAAELVGAGPDAVPTLVANLQDRDSAVRYWAAVALEALGPAAAPAARALRPALTDASPSVRLASAAALCRLGPDTEALWVLGRGLQDKREPVVLQAARAIQGLGDKARPLVGLMELARQQCQNLDGTYKNDNYAMFIDWALKYAMDNCKP